MADIRVQYVFIGKTLSFYQVYTQWTLKSSEGCDLFTNLYRINSFMTLNQIAQRELLNQMANWLNLKTKTKNKKSKLISNSSNLHFKTILILLNHNRVCPFKQIKNFTQAFFLLRNIELCTPNVLIILK